MRKGRRTHSHYNQEPCKEASQIKHRGTRALNKVIGIGASAADPVGNGCNDICCDDEQWEVRLVEGARENDEQEADCQDEGEGNDGFEASGRHGGRRCPHEGALSGTWNSRKGISR